MVIPNTLINTGGTGCNVIGTSYNAFRYQTVQESAPNLLLHPPHAFAHFIKSVDALVLQGAPPEHSHDPGAGFGPLCCMY